SRRRASSPDAVRPCYRPAPEPDSPFSGHTPCGYRSGPAPAPCLAECASYPFLPTVESALSLIPRSSSYVRGVSRFGSKQSFPAANARCYSASHPDSTGCRTASPIRTQRAALLGAHRAPRKTSSTALRVSIEFCYRAPGDASVVFGFLVKTLLPRISSPPTSQYRQATDLSRVRLSVLQILGKLLVF